MSLIESVKNKLIRRKEDYGEIRSRVLGEDRYDYGEKPRALETLPKPELREEPIPTSPPETELEPIEKKPVAIPSMPDIADFPESREPISLKPEEKVDLYRIIEKLNFIEQQLSAIKSQTETINERLKNLELKVARRY